MSGTEVEPDIACSFCTKSPGVVEKMIAGPGVFICNECVSLCNDIIASERVNPDIAMKWRQQISDDDLLELLPRVAAASAKVEEQLTKWIRQARERGITWTRIGEALGMTRQSAWERFSGED